MTADRADQAPQPLDYQSPPPRRAAGAGDDGAYIAPMATFLALIWVGATWPAHYAAAYVARTVIVAAMLWWFWPHYTKIRWNHWWLGIIVGVLGIFQWVPMQLVLQKHFEFFRPGENVYDPFKSFASPAAAWSFIAVRMIGAVLVVPVMEELFWRSFLMRWIDARDFLAREAPHFHELEF